MAARPSPRPEALAQQQGSRSWGRLSRPSRGLEIVRASHSKSARRASLRKLPTRAQAPPAGQAAFFNPEGQPSEGSPPLPFIQQSSLAADGDASSGNERSESGKSASASGTGVVRTLRGALQRYDELLQKHPVLTKAATSCVGFAIGDRLAQSIGGGLYDPWRGVRLALYGFLIDGPVGHAWYKLLDKYIEPDNPQGTKAVLIKTFLDQTVWAVPMTCVFFALLRILEGHPELVFSTIQEKLWHVYMGNLVVWPLAHLINFRFIPTDYRILFNNVVSIAWNAWLSWSCAGTSPGSGAASSVGGHTPGDLPCHKPHSVIDALHLSGAVRQLAALEQLFGAWGMQALPDSEMGNELLMYYVQLKVDLVEKVCGVPTHSARF